MLHPKRKKGKNVFKCVNCVSFSKIIVTFTILFWGGGGGGGLPAGLHDESYLFDISESGIVWSNKTKNALQLQIMHLK
jgi:hypothetical protein